MSPKKRRRASLDDLWISLGKLWIESERCSDMHPLAQDWVTDLLCKNGLISAMPDHVD